jgi:hypothetical protein
MRKQARQPCKPSLREMVGAKLVFGMAKTRETSDWAGLLTQAISSKPDVVPPGWKTLDDLVSETGQGLTTLRRKLPILVEQGKLTRCDFRVVRPSGVILRLPHWKIANRRGNE